MHIYKKYLFLFTLFILEKIHNYLKYVHSSSSIIKVKHIDVTLNTGLDLWNRLLL